MQSAPRMKFEIAAPLPTEPEPILQRIEVATARGLPAFHIIGLPAPEVAEAKERVRAAVEASGFEFPRRRVVINLSPASIRKHGTGLDLGMALAVNQSMSRDQDPGPMIAAWGELGLDGGIKPVGYALRVYASAWQAGVKALVCARDDWPALARARALLETAQEPLNPPPVLLPAKDFKEAVKLCQAFSRGKLPAPEPDPRPGSDERATEGAGAENLLPLSPALERVVALSAAGLHHLLVLGPRGAGKTHALEWRARLEPRMDARARLQRLMIAELSHPMPEPLPFQAPVRRVGAQVRPQALFGRVTSSIVRPGECSLAHGGLLLADELPEWPRDARESLREPLESRRITLTRVNGTVELPASFTLIANGNLCPCGGWPRNKVLPPAPVAGARSGTRCWICECKPAARSAYLERLSGPILDRIDLICQLMPEAGAPSGDADPGRFQALRKRVEVTRELLRNRWGIAPGLLPAEELEKIFVAHPVVFEPLLRARAPNLRFRHKLARVALTLAAWDGMPDGLPRIEHFTEAACYRVMPG